MRSGVGVVSGIASALVEAVVVGVGAVVSAVGWASGFARIGSGVDFVSAGASGLASIV